MREYCLQYARDSLDRLNPYTSERQTRAGVESALDDASETPEDALSMTVNIQLSDNFSPGPGHDEAPDKETTSMLDDAPDTMMAVPRKSESNDSLVTVNDSCSPSHHREISKNNVSGALETSTSGAYYITKLGM